MATDTSDKALNLATKICGYATDLMNAVRALEALIDEHTGSGIEFAPGGVPMDFSGTALQHIDGNDVNLVLTSAASTADWLSSTFNDDVFDKVRP
jgi:hypothetical protein